MIEFILSLFIALLSGTVLISEESSISSDNPVPETTEMIQWPIFNSDEYNYVVLVDGKVIDWSH